jgi:hypothetical protein
VVAEQDRETGTREGGTVANFCEHCEGQRFDRAQVLRALRRIRRELRDQRCGKKIDDALALALKTVARLDLPHLDVEDSYSPVVH